MLADEDAFEVEVLNRYPQAPVLKAKRRPLWVWVSSLSCRSTLWISGRLTLVDVVGHAQSHADVSRCRSWCFLPRVKPAFLSRLLAPLLAEYCVGPGVDCLVYIS
jgi:hypothetical protein